MPDTVTVRLDRRWAPAFVLVGAALGLGAAFAVGPLMDWLLDTVGGAPAPLRLLDQLPFGWLLALLTVAGGIAGLVLFAVWEDEVSTVTVGADRIVVAAGKAETSFDRQEITQIFLDKDELVLLGAGSRELSRTASDGAIAGRLAVALERFGYPWAGTSDPHEFTSWVDRSPDLDARVHELLRRRRRALDDGRTGTAEEARDALLELGAVVRDRDGRQQYRLVTD